MPEPASHVTSITPGQYWPAGHKPAAHTAAGEQVRQRRGAGNNGPVSTATASSFLNVAGTMGG